MRALIHRLRQRRWVHLLVVNTRILLGFAFLPSGLKKVLDQPFTDPSNAGTFHEFLHAFHATGFFYQFVGVVQLACAVLLMTQTLPTVGAALALPVFAAITVFCWSTNAMFTAFMVTLMLLATLGLLLWDLERWRPILVESHVPLPAAAPDDDVRGARAPVDRALWRLCGLGILLLYLVVTARAGGVYRPRGLELDEPAFYLLPLIALFPVITFAVEQRRRARTRPGH